jgi:hypothetical protein
MPTTTNIMQVCESITQALRQRGFFDEGGSDQAREGVVPEAVDAAAAELGMKLTASEGSDRGGTVTVLADGVPGMVTIVAQRRVGDGTPEDGHDSVNPDFGVTWALT